MSEDKDVLLERYSDVLRSLACYLGAGGWNSEGLIDPDVADAKIRWGIDDIIKGQRRLSEIQASRWCRENGLNVPEHWRQE